MDYPKGEFTVKGSEIVKISQSRSVELRNFESEGTDTFSRPRPLGHLENAITSLKV